MPRILLVEDEPGIADTLIYALESEGFICSWAETVEKAWPVFREGCDCVILDVGLPDGNGFTLCQAFRKERNTPIIFLTARRDEVDRIVGLEIGADDYVTKPFSPREVTARVRAVLRRYPNNGGEKSVGWKESASPSDGKTKIQFQVDESRRRILYQGKPLDLSAVEYRILQVLVEHPGRVYSRTQLMETAWNGPASALERTVDAHVKSLRAKLHAQVPDEDPIITHRGFGYALREGI